MLPRPHVTPFHRPEGSPCPHLPEAFLAARHLNWRSAIGLSLRCLDILQRFAAGAPGCGADGRSVTGVANGQEEGPRERDATDPAAPRLDGSIGPAVGRRMRTGHGNALLPRSAGPGRQPDRVRCRRHLPRPHLRAVVQAVPPDHRRRRRQRPVRRGRLGQGHHGVHRTAGGLRGHRRPPQRRRARQGRGGGRRGHPHPDGPGRDHGRLQPARVADPAHGRRADVRPVPRRGHQLAGPTDQGAEPDRQAPRPAGLGRPPLRQLGDDRELHLLPHRQGSRVRPAGRQGQSRRVGSPAPAPKATAA
jgi:hypothetical protein